MLVTQPLMLSLISDVSAVQAFFHPDYNLLNGEYVKSVWLDFILLLLETPALIAILL